MSKLDSAKAIRNLANLYRDMDSAAKALEEIGSLEQAATEARNATQAEQARLTDLKARADAAAADVIKAKERAAEIEATATAAANQTVEAAERSALQTLADAKERATSIETAARGKADEMIASAQMQVDVLSENAGLLRGQNAELRDKVTATRNELNEIEARLAAARDELRKLL